MLILWQFTLGDSGIGRLFSQKGKTVEEQQKTLPQVAEDLRDLIGRCCDDAAMIERSSDQALVRAFEEHGEIVEGQVNMRPKSRIDSMQNPSDPDATFDGHPGPGYPVPIAETCGDNEVQLIVGALAQTASEHDAHALEPILEQLKAPELLPESMLANTAFGSDANVPFAAALGVEWVSPVSGPNGEEKAEEAPRRRMLRRRWSRCRSTISPSTSGRGRWNRARRGRFR